MWFLWTGSKDCFSRHSLGVHTWRSDIVFLLKSFRLLVKMYFWHETAQKHHKVSDLACIRGLWVFPFIACSLSILRENEKKQPWIDSNNSVSLCLPAWKLSWCPLTEIIDSLRRICHSRLYRRWSRDVGGEILLKGRNSQVVETPGGKKHNSYVPFSL